MPVLIKMSTYQDPFRLPVQYQLNSNWRKSSSSSEESGEETTKRRRKIKKRKSKKQRCDLEMHLVPAVASPIPSPPSPMEGIVDNKLCEEYRASGCCSLQTCFSMHSTFPCKFYYLGLDCPDGQECKLSHKPEFLSNDMKYGLLDHIFKSTKQVLGEEFFNFKKTNTVQEMVHKLEKRLSEFPLPPVEKIVYMKEEVQKVEEPLDMRVSWFSIIFNLQNKNTREIVPVDIFELLNRVFYNINCYFAESSFS